jgi:hypothetical protein
MPRKEAGEGSKGKPEIPAGLLHEMQDDRRILSAGIQHHDRLARERFQDPAVIGFPIGVIQAGAHRVLLREFRFDPGGLARRPRAAKRPNSRPRWNTGPPPATGRAMRERSAVDEKALSGATRISSDD